MGENLIKLLGFQTKISIANITLHKHLFSVTDIMMNATDSYLKVRCIVKYLLPHKNFDDECCFEIF